MELDDRRAAQLRGRGLVGTLAIVVIFLAGNVVVAGFLIPLGALLVLAWARLSRTPWRDIGYAAPRSWLVTIVAGLALGIALKLSRTFRIRECPELNRRSSPVSPSGRCTS